MADQFFPIRGGLDQETPGIAIAPGRCIAALNHEMEPLGVRRTEGFERFDGRPAPSSVIAYELTFKEGFVEPVIGSPIFGNISGASCTVLQVLDASLAEWISNKATGRLIVSDIDGSFIVGEGLNNTFGGYHCELSAEPALIDAVEDPEGYSAVVEAQRAEITAVPGSGPVRGVLWFDGRLTAWRDNADATACETYFSTSAGWGSLGLGTRLNYTDGGPYVIEAGDTLTGASSGNIANVRAVIVDSGDWADGDAAGFLIVDPIGGNISNEDVNVGVHLSVATIPSGGATSVTLPPGGRYEFDIHNFYATEGLERAYGANGVGPAFEFDGLNIMAFSTGMADDRPFMVREHKDHLFLAFPHGSLQHSELGAPRQWSGAFGAAELGMGHEFTNILATETTLLITTTDSIKMLTGNDSSDWLLQPVSKDSGAVKWTAARVGEAIYLDHRGVRSISSATNYANFKLGTFTSLINKLLENKRKAGVFPVASCVVKTKSQYLLFFDDGSGVSIFFGVKQPEAMPFQYPFVVQCLHVAEVEGVERIFVGASDGFVYELNKGTSFDGEPIEAFVQLAFNHHGDPRMLKRWHGIELEVRADPGTQIGVIPQFDGGASEQPLSEELALDIDGGGGLWGIANWGEFIWSSPQQAQTHLFIDGAGVNMSPILVSRSSTVSSYTIAGATVVYSGRGRRR